MKKTVTLAISLIIAVFFQFSCQTDLGDLDRVTVIENVIGKWHVVRDDGGITSEYQVEIIEDNEVENGIILTNFINNGADAHATINDLEITVPSQQLGTNTVNASGVISNDFQSIEWNITIDNDNVTAIFTPGTITKKLAL